MINMLIHKLLKYIGVCTLLLLMTVVAGCSQEIVPTVRPITDSGDDVTVGLLIPDMTRQDTRALGNIPGAGLKLTVFEFALGADATNTFPTRTYNAEITSATTAVNNGQIVNFKIPNLMKTTEPRVLHFVVAPDYITIGDYGSEAAIFQSLSVGNGTEAYWARVEFPTGYAVRSTDENGDEVLTITDEVKEKFRNIPVIRNFAQVSVTANLNNFQLYGFELINVPSSGTVAPYNVSKKSFASLLDDSDNMKTYSEIVADYQGLMPPAARFINTEEEARGWTTATGGNHPFTTLPKYFYEHPFESTRRTYVLIRGSYNHPERGWTEGYYKIDLGNMNTETNVFQYYDALIRNINYSVTITQVSAEGYATPSEAIDGLTFNNISADVDTQNMLSVSDGQNMISVSNTGIVITDQTPFDFYYQYTTDVTTPGTTKGNGNSVAGFKAVDLKPGEVIASVTDPVEVDYQGEKWMRVTITPTAIAGGDGKRQQFWIVDGNGLGREITLFSHVPFDYSNLVVYAGSDNDYPSGVTPNVVSPNEGEPFTVYFNLPAGLPQEIFPLEFVLESNRQNMENNPIGTLAVQTGETYFPTTTAYTEPAVKYVKTVSYLEYMYKYEAGTNNVDMETENPDHLVRCRLRTINKLSDLPGNPASTTTYVLVYNNYFNCKTTSTDPAQWPGVVTFTRTQ